MLMPTGTKVYTPKFNPLLHQPDGTVAMIYPTGSQTVLSLQMDGTFAVRDIDKIDRWEKATILPGLGLLYENLDANITEIVFYVLP